MKKTVNGELEAMERVETEDMKRRNIFIFTPLRAAHSLRLELHIDEDNYNGIVGYAQRDPRAYYIYGCLDEVTKFATACIRWNEFLAETGEELDQSDPEAAKVVHRATVESVANEQQMWARKLNELLSQLILFTKTNQQHYYRLYLLATYLNQYQRLQSDFSDFYGFKNENAQSSIDGALADFEKMYADHGIEDFWLFQSVKFEKKKIIHATARELFKKALSEATDIQKLVLGVSYESGYSSPSRSIHVTIGGISNPVTSEGIESELMRTSLVAMHVVSIAHELAGVQPTGDALLFEKSYRDSTSKELIESISNPGVDVGDLVFAYGSSICLVQEKRVSEYGYCSFKVKYITGQLLPDIAEDFFPSRYVRLIVSKEKLKNNLKGIFSKYGVEPEKIDSISDDDFVENVSLTITTMEKSGDLNLFLRQENSV